MRKMQTFWILIFAFTFSFSLHAQEDTADQPPGMEALSHMVGVWSVTTSQFASGEWQAGETRTAEIVPLLGGAIQTESVDVVVPAFSFSLYSVYSYDQFRALYRLGVSDSSFGLLDIYEGDFDDQGRLVVDNLRSGTHFIDQTGTVSAFRLIYDFTGPDMFRFTVNVTQDEGVTWSPFVRSDYQRQAE